MTDRDYGKAAGLEDLPVYREWLQFETARDSPNGLPPKFRVPVGDFIADAVQNAVMFEYEWRHDRTTHTWEFTLVPGK